MSFAYLVYASSWLKRYHPAAFCAALLNAQPMGFYSPQSLVDDARRHGVEVRRPDINLSDAAAILESTPQTRWGSAAGEPPHALGAGRPGGADGAVQRPYPRRRPGRSRSRTSGGRSGPYRDMSDLARRTGLRDRAPGGARHRRRLRRFRPDAARGAVGGGRRRPGQTGPASGYGHRRARRRRCPGWPTWTAGRGRVGDRPVAGRASGPVHPGRARPGRARCRSRGWAGSRPAPGCGSAGSSPTGSGRRPRAGSPSSTWRTRPGCST